MALSEWIDPFKYKVTKEFFEDAYVSILPYIPMTTSYHNLCIMSVIDMFLHIITHMKIQEEQFIYVLKLSIRWFVEMEGIRKVRLQTIASNCDLNTMKQLEIDILKFFNWNLYKIPTIESECIKIEFKDLSVKTRDNVNNFIRDILENRDNKMCLFSFTPKERLNHILNMEKLNN